MRVESRDVIVSSTQGVGGVVLDESVQFHRALSFTLFIRTPLTSLTDLVYHPTFAKPWRHCVGVVDKFPNLSMLEAGELHPTQQRATYYSTDTHFTGVDRV
jgi:hypothetical protein